MASLKSGGEAAELDFRPAVDVKSIYRQWQEGKLLDAEERLALRGSSEPNGATGRDLAFGEILRKATEEISSRDQ